MWNDSAPVADDRPTERLRGALRIGVAALALVSLLIWIVRAGYSLYALLLFDLGLVSFNTETIIGIGAMAIALVAFDYGLSTVRFRALAAIGAAIDHWIAPTVIDDGDTAKQPLGALDQIREGLSTGAAVALVDLLAVPIWLILLTALGWPLGLFPAIVAAIALLVTWLQVRRLIALQGDGDLQRQERDRLLAGIADNGGMIGALGMRARVTATLGLIDRRLADNGRTFAQARQRLIASLSFIIGIAVIGTATLAAWRIIEDLADSGTLAAALVLILLMGLPALAVVRGALPLVQARAAYRRMRAVAADWTPTTRLVTLPPPTARLSIESLVVAVPGERRALLQKVACESNAGDIIAIVGPSGVGRSELLRVLAGQVRPASGAIRLDGSKLEQWNADDLARHIGYLPQEVDLHEGTVAQNICRFDPAADPQAIIAAAQRAGVHDLIVRLADGYETMVGLSGRRLAMSQRQRIGLARAVYGSPFLVLLDHPSAHLDPASTAATVQAIARIADEGAIVMMSTGDSNLLEIAQFAMVLQPGGMVDFGPKDDVRQRMIKRQRGRITRQDGGTDATEPTDDGRNRSIADADRE
ncbi:ATP-binding cassette domain-containing protein [Sphingomonas sp. FW199]|uniref:ATP-binding cassette domain-containing protein n=1 Tax=Sphingomonas sp. FW199 TaxID=3400217 RepID=UPI003CE8B9EF